MNIKEQIKKSCINQWEIAELLNVSEFTLSRWLRRPEKLNKETINKIDEAIKVLKNSRVEEK